MQIIRLEFLRFDVESSSSTCAYDSVTVYDGMDYTAPILNTFCGSILPGNIISSQSFLFVSFKSDSSKTMDGFMIKYIAVDSGKQSVFNDNNIAFPFMYTYIHT